VVMLAGHSPKELGAYIVVCPSALCPAAPMSSAAHIHAHVNTMTSLVAFVLYWHRSLLWMAPETLRGARLKDGQGPALDVYSYAIVLWEIWTRARPWDEVVEQGIQFSAKLTKLVNAGVRPMVPVGCGPAPDGYRALMEQCWAGDPARRPTFVAILAVLTEVSQGQLGASNTKL
jgi:hypothetical protein